MQSRPGQTWLGRFKHAIVGGAASLLVALWVGYSSYDPTGRTVDFLRGYDRIDVAILTICAVAFVGFVYYDLRNVLAAAKIGAVDVTWEPTDFPAGDTLDVQVRFEPRADGELDACELELVSFYYEKHRSDHDEPMNKRVVYDREKVVAGSRDVRFKAGETVEYAASFDTSISDGGSSFGHERAAGFDQKWELTVHLKISGFPDWSETYRLAGGWDA